MAVEEPQREKKKKKKTLAGEIRTKVSGKLFGDSVMKGLKQLLEKSEAPRVQVTSHPRKGNREIRRKIERTPVEKCNLVIIAEGGNLYRKDETGGNNSTAHP